MIYFFSYGDSKYVQSKQRIRQEAISMGFDEVNVYGPENLPKEFIEKTAPHLLAPRGAGYWLWKSHFLKSTFDRMNDGDYCIYADAGCHININGKQRLQEYMEMIKEDDCGIISFEITGLTEAMYTNEKVFEYFEIDENDEMRKTSQIVGGVLILRKCENSTNIVNEYYRMACEHPDLFSDQWNNYKRTPEFRDHRHDQSILGILRKRYKSLIIKDETYSENWNDLKNMPILATRIRQ